MPSRTLFVLSIAALLTSALVWAHPADRSHLGAAVERGSAGVKSKDALERHQRAVDAFNAQDADAVVDLYAAEGVLHDPQVPEPIRGREAIREGYAQMFRTFPDIQVTILDRHVVDDRMMYELRLRGTNDGPIATPEGKIPATGRSIDLPAAVFADLDADGRFRETRRYYDVAEMMRQLGLDDGD